MYLRSLSESLRRRWYLAVVGLCLVGALAVLTYTHVPPTYEANANVVLLPPRTSVVEGGNPYLYLGGLGQALDVLTRSIDGDTTREGILGVRKDIDYAIEPDRTTAGPILVIQATGPTVKDTLGVLTSVLDTVPVNLRQLQDDLGVSASSQITSMTLTVDQKPTVVGKNRLRAVIGVAAIGAAAMSLLIGALDGLILSRSRRRAERATEPRPADRPGRTRRGESLTPTPVTDHETGGDRVGVSSEDPRSFDLVIGLEPDDHAAAASRESRAT